MLHPQINNLGDVIGVFHRDRATSKELHRLGLDAFHGVFLLCLRLVHPDHTPAVTVAVSFCKILTPAGKEMKGDELVLVLAWLGGYIAFN